MKESFRVYAINIIVLDTDTDSAYPVNLYLDEFSYFLFIVKHKRDLDYYLLDLLEQVKQVFKKYCFMAKSLMKQYLKSLQQQLSHISFHNVHYYIFLFVKSLETTIQSNSTEMQKMLKNSL